VDSPPPAGQYQTQGPPGPVGHPPRPPPFDGCYRPWPPQGSCGDFWFTPPPPPPNVYNWPGLAQGATMTNEAYWTPPGSAEGGFMQATPPPPPPPPPQSAFLNPPPPPPQPAFLNAPPPHLPVRKNQGKPRYTFDFCVFCKNNGEDERFYLSHTLKDDMGLVSCPILRQYKCPICGATGPVAHTLKYCPENKTQVSEGERYETVFNELSITQLKRMRSSTGKARNNGGQHGGFGGIGRHLPANPAEMAQVNELVNAMERQRLNFPPTPGMPPFQQDPPPPPPPHHRQRHHAGPPPVQVCGGHRHGGLPRLPRSVFMARERNRRPQAPVGTPPNTPTSPDFNAEKVCIPPLPPFQPGCAVCNGGQNGGGCFMCCGQPGGPTPPVHPQDQFRF